MFPVAAKSNSWQAKYCWQDRFKFIMESGQLSDCEILIGAEKKPFKCHKQILAIASPVFEEIFYTKSHLLDTIVYPDIELDTFRQILNFVYLNKIETTSFPFHILGNLLHAAQIFKMTDFHGACIYYLNVCQWPLEHIFSIYNSALFHNEKVLLAVAKEHIASNKDQLLKHSTLFTQSFQRFVNILTLFARPCSELLLFRTIEKYCIQNKLIASKTEELCKMINFLDMTPTEFAEGPAISKLLDREESFEIMLKLCKEHKCKENVFKFTAPAKLQVEK